VSGGGSDGFVCVGGGRRADEQQYGWEGKEWEAMVGANVGGEYREQRLSKCTAVLINITGVERRVKCSYIAQHHYCECST